MNAPVIRDLAILLHIEDLYIINISVLEGLKLKEEQIPVSRVVRRRTKPGCERAYEALLKGMLQASSHFPGYLSATVIPPHAEADQGEYQIVQRFATQEDLERWDQSPERAMWHERIHPLAEGAPVYRLVTGLEVWFAPRLVVASAPPPRWKMTAVSWLGIFPTAAVGLGFFGPILQSWPFLFRMAVITAFVAILMSYLIMPRLAVWMQWWLRK